MQNDESTQSSSPELAKRQSPTLEKDFLGHIYSDINKRSKNQFNMYTLNELTSFPLLFCEKLVQSITLNQSDLITKEQFLDTFYTLYFGSIEDIASLIGDICSFKDNSIWINDIKLLLLHFHMRLMTNDTEKEVLQIVNEFYNEEEDKKNDYYISIEEFVLRSINTNIDIIAIFIAYLKKFSFFTKEQLEYYYSIVTKKGFNTTPIPLASMLNKKNISNDCLEYIKSIEKASMTQDPYNDDDLETLESISTFESEVADALSILSRNQLDIPINNFHCANTETSAQQQGRRASDFTNKAKKLFLSRAVNKTKSVKANYVNPINHQTEPQPHPLSELPLQNITLYKQSSKDNKLQMVKLIQIGQMIFYMKYDSTSNQFTFSKIIVLSMLFPKTIQEIIIDNKTYLRLEFLSVIHNQLTYKYFLGQNEDELNAFIKFISTIQNLKSIEDSFELGRNLGSGKFGKVFLAKHNLSGKEFAIKAVCKSDKEHSERTFQSYKWEKDIGLFLKNVSCDYIEKFYEVIETAHYLYYIIEYYPDGNLKDLITESNKITWNDINDICIQLIKGVSVMHQYGIIHRDIKHANTLVSLNDKGQVCIKLIDFGLSKVIGMKDKAQERFGSLSFKAPELILGKEYSFGVDVWAIGITVYYLAFRDFPVKACNKHMLKKKIVNKDYTTLLNGNTLMDNIVSNIIYKCLVKEPKKRISINKLLRSLLKYTQ